MRLAVFGLLSLALCSRLAGALEPAEFSLRLVGSQAFPDHAITVDGVTVGGLSGLDFDPTTGRFLAISDDPSTPGRTGAHLFEIELTYDAAGIEEVTFVSATPLLRPDGTPFPHASADPEAVRRLPSGQLLWASEGYGRSGVPPFVREATADGRHLRDFDLPSRFSPRSDERAGSRHNLVFESLALTPDGRWAVTATEGALREDGPEASALHASPSRVIFLDLDTGRSGREIVYWNDPILQPTEGFSVSGLVELLALGSESFLALERSYTNEMGHSVVLYRYDTRGATDVSDLESLADAEVVAGRKTFVADLGCFGLTLSNLEGMTFGPDLETGNLSLVIVSDDNFDGETQFLVVELIAGR